MCIALAMASTDTQAQNGINSPYSRYGFGMQADRSMGFNKGMAGVAQGWRDGQIVNVANPASYSAVDSLTALFDMGFTMQNGNYKMNNVQQNLRNSSFDYIAMHFRASRGLGMALGVLPYTKINYSITSESEAVPGTEDITSNYTFNGNGGLHQAFFGVGWQVFKPISIGVNGSYLFGNYTHTTSMAFNQASIYTISREYSADISTWMADFALQFTQPIAADKHIVVGATYGLGHDVKNKAMRKTQSYSSATASVEGSTTDTIRNAFQLPHTISAGLAYIDGTRLAVGADFELQKWSSCRFPLQNSEGEYISSTGSLNDKMRISVGGKYSPKGRISYKAGAYYSRSYANADFSGNLDSKPTEFGLTAGVTLPITNRNIWYNSPKLNLSVSWSHSKIPYTPNTAAIAKQTLSENYLRLSIGITFSERWFYKWKME